MSGRIIPTIFLKKKRKLVMSDSLWPHGLLPTRLVHGILQSILERVAIPSPGNLPNPGIEPRSPALQADSLPAEPQEKSKKTQVGSLSLLQGTFPTQELNRGLLHCRWILYQLSHQGSPLRNTTRQSKKYTMDAHGTLGYPEWNSWSWKETCWKFYLYEICEITKL